MTVEILSKVWVPSLEEIAHQKDWIEKQITEIGEDTLEELIQQAVNAREKAFPLHSHYSVGAAMLSISGNIFSEANFETPRRSQCLAPQEAFHAEGLAIVTAISDGEIDRSGSKFIEVMVVSHSAVSGPCELCGHKIAEHCDNALIIDVDEEGNIQMITSFRVLFHRLFGPAHLEIE